MLLVQDGTEADMKSARIARELMQASPNHHLLVLCVLPSSRHYYCEEPHGLKADLTDVQREIFTAMKTNIITEFEIHQMKIQFDWVIGHQAADICQVAEEAGADMMIVAKHDLRSAIGCPKTSMSSEVLHHAQMPVIVAR
jgi:hypothetical protein